jgi:TPR repeat protein
MQGNAESLWRLGMMQMNGLGMVENQPLGFENFVKAAEQGHGFAHHMIAVKPKQTRQCAHHRCVNSPLEMVQILIS